MIMYEIHLQKKKNKKTQVYNVHKKKNAEEESNVSLFRC